MKPRRPTLRGRALHLATTARPAFQPVKIERERWINPESSGDRLMARVSLPAISMYLDAIGQGGSGS